MTDSFPDQGVRRPQFISGVLSHTPITQNHASAVNAPAIIGTSSGSLHRRIANVHRTQKMIANKRRDIAVAPVSEPPNHGDSELLTIIVNAGLTAVGAP